MCSELLVSGNLASHPLVGDDISHRGTSGRLMLQQHGSQLFEFFTNVLLAVLGPEVCRIVYKLFVALIVQRCHFERVFHQAHDEQHHSKCKYIDVSALVRASGYNLGSHVSFSSESSPVEAIRHVPSQFDSVSQIDQLDIVRAGQHDILWLDVSVCHS